MKASVDDSPHPSHGLIPLFISILIVAPRLTGQVEAWRARYDGSDASSWEVPAGIACDSAGNVYITGSSDAGTDDFDFATVKYDPEGVELWVSRYDGPEHDNDEARDLAVDSDGPVYVTGSSMVSDSASTLSIEGWSEVQTPWGPTISPRVGPIEVSLGSGQSVSRAMRQPLPVNALAGGPYTHGVKAGTLFEQVPAAGDFEFDILSRR